MSQEMWIKAQAERAKLMSNTASMVMAKAVAEKMKAMPMFELPELMQHHIALAKQISEAGKRFSPTLSDSDRAMQDMIAKLSETTRKVTAAFPSDFKGIPVTIPSPASNRHSIDISDVESITIVRKDGSVTIQTFE